MHVAHICNNGKKAVLIGSPEKVAHGVAAAVDRQWDIQVAAWMACGHGARAGNHHAPSRAKQEGVQDTFSLA